MSSRRQKKHKKGAKRRQKEKDCEQQLYGDNNDDGDDDDDDDDDDGKKTTLTRGMLDTLTSIPRWKVVLLVGLYLTCFFVSILHPSFSPADGWLRMFHRGGSSSSNSNSADEGCLGMALLSHRAAMPPSLGGSDNSDRPPGSVEAAVAIMQRGVCSFDVDCFLTADGVLVVGHPGEIQTRLSLPEPPTSLTLSDLRMLDRGKTATVFEFLRSVVELAPAKGPCHRKTTRSTAATAAAAAGGGADFEGKDDAEEESKEEEEGEEEEEEEEEEGEREEGPGGGRRRRRPPRRTKKRSPLRLLVEPKGEAASEESLRMIATAARAAGLGPREVGVWVPTAELAAAATATRVLAPLLAVKSHEDPFRSWLGAAAGAEGVWDAVGPPIDFPALPDFAARRHGRGQALFLWCVDTKEQLFAALAASADGIISNEPFLMAGHLASACPGWTV